MKSVIEKLKDGEYFTNIPYEYVTVPINEDTMTVRQAREHIEAQKLAKREHSNRRRADVARLEEQFHTDLATENGLVGHPKEKKLFQWAWDLGHSSGLGEVAQIYEDLSELVK